MTQSTLDEKHQGLRQILRELKGVAVAFSGGVDSTFLLKVAIDTLGPNKVVAVTGRSDSLARADLDRACAFASLLGAEHVIIHTDEFDNTNYTSNPANRCYFCKISLYKHLERFLAGRGPKEPATGGCQATSAGWRIVDGTNADDPGDFRPGLEAAAECGVRAPVAEAGLTKADVRELSKRLGLETSDAPASPCLSSRVPYGEPITPEKLRMIEAGEAFLHGLGIAECRVRHHDGHRQAGSPAPVGGRLARIEVPPKFIPLLAESETAARLETHFRSLGYNYVTLDLRGFRSGRMNEVIAPGNARPPS